jgi:hypothetical protein
MANATCQLIHLTCVIPLLCDFEKQQDFYRKNLIAAMIAPLTSDRVAIFLKLANSLTSSMRRELIFLWEVGADFIKNPCRE